MKPFSFNYLGTKAPYTHLFDKLVRGWVGKFCDLTIGGGSVAMFFGEERRARSMILNDCSDYSRMIARGFFGQRPRQRSELVFAVQTVKPEQGFMSREQWYSKFFDDEVRAYCDGYVQRHAKDDFLLINLLALLGRGCVRFPGQFSIKMKELTLPQFKAALIGRLERYAARILPFVDCEITNANYLDLPKRFNALRGYVVYLDPAWPAQPDHKTRDATSAYGFYSERLLSIARQEQCPTPAEYSVTRDDFYAGMRETIARMSKHNTMLIAYQTTREEVAAVKRSLFNGQRVRMADADKNEGSTLREYLFLVC